MSAPAIMRILGWKAYGLRCPDHEISCADSGDCPYPVTLIQMPNGTGKTTTLALLRVALSGAAINVSEFRKRDSDESYGFFEVILLLNKRRATIRINFDFENSRASYKTTYGSGQRDGFHPPSDFRRFMNENFVNFYVFDGELAEHLLDRNHTDARIVVENLFQMNAFDAMIQKVGEYWNEKTQKVSATEQRGLNRRQNRLIKLRKRLEKLKKDKKELLEKREKLMVLFDGKKAVHRQEIEREEERSQDLSNAEINVERLKSKVREESLDVLECMRDPHALSSFFANSLFALKDGLDKVKLPESAAREFFEDLAGESECVCGRPINTEISETIRFRASQYLGTEDVSLLNAMKTAIKDAIGDDPDVGEKDLNTRIENLSSVVDEERHAKNHLDSLNFEAEQADPAIKIAREDIDKLRDQIEDVDNQLARFDSKDQTQPDERTFGIEVLEKLINVAETKLSEITDTLAEKAKRDVLKVIISNAHEKARQGITTELCNQANERISDLMPRNNISVDRIAHNLILEGQEGASVGETLSVAYAFLATLFHRSDHQLPLVVDSPAGPIDMAVRPKIGELVPKLTGQFIAFTISSERAQFIAPLKRACSTEIQFITLFRKGPEDMQREAHKKGVVLETDDGLNVSGENFFSAFQLEEEESF